MEVADGAHVAQVLERDGLPATGVVGDGDEDDRDVPGAAVGEERVERADVHVALERVDASAGSRPSAMTRSTASAPVASTLARVVSKCVLFGTTFPGPPRTLNRIFSAARPWWVGITWVNGKRVRTASRNVNQEGEPA